MEFWGVEVKSGETLKVSPGEGYVIHLSQASIGESKKGKEEAVPVHLKVGEQKLVIGTLSADKFPQIQYDVVIEKDFELSHNSKSGSVFFVGYKTQNVEEGDDEIYSGDEFDSESEDEELPVENGKPEPVKAAGAKSVSAGNSKVKIDQLVEAATSDSDDDDFSDSDEGLSDDDDEMDGSSDEEDEKTPTPKKDNKKRPTESASKTPVPSKKVKVATPQKSADGKKSNAPHVATPHPSKQAPKTPKSENGKTPASAVKATCSSCSKTFNSEKGLDSHTKAKHAAK